MKVKKVYYCRRCQGNHERWSLLGRRHYKHRGNVIIKKSK